ncbi:hypothetical protein ACI1BF_003461 [Cronobacter turicensis]
MKEFKGTHGPWKAVQQYDDEISVVDGGGFKVVTAERIAILMDWDKKGFEHWADEGGSRNLYGSEQFANAHLIAAAPDLLEALQGFVDLFPDVIDGDAIMPALDKGYAAIAKAIGEEE